jgi:hypothetical protein
MCLDGPNAKDVRRIKRALWLANAVGVVFAIFGFFLLECHLRASSARDRERSRLGSDRSAVGAMPDTSANVDGNFARPMGVGTAGLEPRGSPRDCGTH